MIKKTILLSTVLILAGTSVAFADGNAFTPLDFDDASYGNTKTVASTTTTNKGQVSTTQARDITGSSNMQSAILELENAQVEVRNDLLNYKAKYSEVDRQYTAVKTERKALKKQVKAIEKKIKQLDKTKEKIRKYMM